MVTNQIRRTVLSVLVDERQTTRAKLASELASDDAIPATDVESLEIALHHNHLPKLADERYIEYDTRNGDVVLWKGRETVREELAAESGGTGASGEHSGTENNGRQE